MLAGMADASAAQIGDRAGGLDRQLGLWAVFSIAAGAMISSGLFVLPGLAYQITGPSLVLAYALAGLLNVPTMLAQAEVSTAMPRSAGSYLVVERSLGAYLGTIAGLINWSSIGLKAAFAMVGIGTLAELAAPQLGVWAVKGTAIAACAVFTLFNLRSVRGTSWLQGALVAGLLAALGFFILAGLPDVALQRFRPAFLGGFRNFLTVTGMVFVSYGGLTKVVDIAEEVRRPGRTLPLGMFLSYAVVNALYVGVAFVTVGVLPPEKLSGSLHPVSDAAAASLGLLVAWMVGAGAFLAYATTGNAGLLSASRSPMAMSRDGLLPPAFGRTHPRFHTPHIAVVVTGAAMALVIAFLSLEGLVKTASAMLILSMMLINVSVIVMRYSRLEGYRPVFRMPGVPWLPLATILVYVFLLIEMGTTAMLITSAFVAAASVWYVVYVQHRIDRESAAAYLVRRIVSRDIARSGLEDELVQMSLERDEIVEDRFDRLARDAVILDIPEPIRARELFRRVSEAMAPRLGLPAERLEDLLLAREREASTVLQPGLAVPHVLVPGEHVFEMAMVRCVAGAVFSDLTEPVHVAFVLAGSRDERNFHLRALMAVAHILQEPDFMARWMAAANEGQLRDIILLARRPREKPRAIS